MNSPYKYLASPVVGLVVGQQRQTLSVHSDLLLEIPFFKDYIDPDQKPFRSTGDTVFLPDDDPNLVAELIGCIYRGSVEPLPDCQSTPKSSIIRACSGKEAGQCELKQEFYEKSKEQLMRYIDLYIVAEKYSLERIQNLVVDRIVAYHRCAKVNIKEIATLSQAGILDCSLKLFLVGGVAREFGHSTPGHKTSFSTQEMECLMPGYTESLGQLTKDDIVILLDEIGKIAGYKKMLSRSSIPWGCPTTIDKICAYHKHNLTRRCGEPTEPLIINPPGPLSAEVEPTLRPTQTRPSEQPSQIRCPPVPKKHMLGPDPPPPAAVGSDSNSDDDSILSIQARRKSAVNGRKRARISEKSHH